MVQQSQTQTNEIDKTAVFQDGIAAIKEVLLAAIAANTANNTLLMEGMSGAEKLELTKIQSSLAMEIMKIMADQMSAIQAMEAARKE